MEKRGGRADAGCTVGLFVESKKPDGIHGKVWLDAEYGGELELEN